MHDAAQQLQDVLNHEIPITLALGIQVENLTDHSVTLTAPLENNINHKSTAFGGSLYSLAVLAGWSLIHTQLARRDMQAQIVIQESNIQYLRPVTSDLRASCHIGSSTAMQKFCDTFARKGRARIALEVEMRCDDQPAVLFSGKYVIHR